MLLALWAVCLDWPLAHTSAVARVAAGLKEAQQLKEPESDVLEATDGLPRCHGFELVRPS